VEKAQAKASQVEQSLQCAAVRITVRNMETITCDAKRIKVEEIEQIGGHLNATAEYTDTLYRGPAGRYYLKQEENVPLSPNASYTMPRDRAWVARMEQRKSSTEQISEKEAMLWYADTFLNDDKLRKRFVDLIERFA
jgi:hypothetical protein